MATTPKVTAKRNRTTKSTTTARSVGVKARKVTAKVIADTYAKARHMAHGAQVRPPKPPTGAFLAGILTADKMPALPADIQGRSPKHAEARRAWCAEHGAPTVTTADVVHAHRAKHADKVDGVTHDRPENTVRANLIAYCAVMGLAPDTYRAVRGEAYEAGFLAPVYIVRNR